MNTDSTDILKRALERERLARKESEKILEAKSLELHIANVKLRSLVDEKKSQLKGVFENLVDAFIVIDLKGEILQINDAAKLLFGDNLKVGFNILKTIFQKDLKHTKSSYQELIKTGFFKNYIGRIVTDNREIKTVHVNGSLVLDENENPIAIQGIVRDITERLQIEQTNKQLLVKLKNSNLELEDYARIVSHDLKSPLRSVSALLSFLKEDYQNLIDGDGLDKFNLIDQKLEKMESLIEGILQYSSIHIIELVPAKVDLNLIIDQISSVIYVPDHVTISVKNKLPTIFIDKTRVYQLFQNIIGNAVSHIEKDVGKVFIDFSETPSSYIFSIQDNGTGIDQKYHKKIFDVFQSMSSKKESTGIGLSIVKRIVDLYQGKVSLKSELAIGTTFYIELPKKALK